MPLEGIVLQMKKINKYKGAYIGAVTHSGYRSYTHGKWHFHGRSSPGASQLDFSIAC